MQATGDFTLHEPVLLSETISYLVTAADGVYVDCTVGGGGHLNALANRLSSEAVIIGIDRDGDVLERTASMLKDLALKLYLVNDNYQNIVSIVSRLGFTSVDGIMMDLGVSSFQLDEEERGFSFQKDAPLDMRMDRRQPFSARDIVNNWDESALRHIIFTYGEERYAGRIAAALVKAREKEAIVTTGQLVEIIRQAVPAAYCREKHPARRTFQALRIAVNQELEELSETLPQAFDLLKPGGRLAVITFHSLEDRIVKKFMQGKAIGCICPPDQPVCTCGHRPEGKVLTRKAIIPSKEEQEKNPRARSARLRVIEKVLKETEGE